jgi:POT family proton-dependent oligopeptide transporter
MAINIGAAISYAVLPGIRDNYSYQVAFICPAALMTISFLIFAAGKPFYAVEKIERRKSTAEESREKLATLMRVGGVFLVVTFFWAVFDQSHTTWVYFARDFTDLKLFGQEFSPEQFGTLNPVLIVIFVPLFQVGWTLLERFGGIRIRPTDKMMLGFILTAITMGILAYAGFSCGAYTEDAAGRRTVEEASKVTIWWEVAAFIFLTSAEVLISVTGLELAFVVAPASMKSFVTAMWLLTVGIANLFINAPLGRLYAYMPPGEYFAILTGIMIAVMIAFFFVAQQFTTAAKKRDDDQKAAALASLQGQAENGFAPAAAKDGIQDKSRREGIVDSNDKPPQS